MQLLITAVFIFLLFIVILLKAMRDDFVASFNHGRFYDEFYRVTSYSNYNNTLANFYCAR